MRFILALAALVSVPVAASTLQATDWKLYGGAALPDGTVSCFYDAGGVTSVQPSRVRVWTKCLRQEETGSVDSDEIVDATVRKVKAGYVPPLASVLPIDFNGVIASITSEQIANMSNIAPVSRIFYEINCSEKISRELSLMVVSDGRPNYYDRPRDWEQIAPETNMARLASLSCR